MTLSRFVCWDAEHVFTAVAPDVAAASDAAVLATHQSLPIERSAAQSTEAVEQIREAQALEEFLANGEDPAITAIVGPAGSGKSHLIRWMYAQLRDDERYHVIHVPRQGTNLRTVIRNVLEHVPGPESERLRGLLDRAVSRLDPDHAAATLLDNLRRAVQFSPPAGATPRETAVWQGLSPGLARLLGRHEYGERFAEPGGLLNDVVRRIYESAEAGERTRFTGDDLRVRMPDMSPRTFGPEAHRTYMDIMSTPETAESAARLLNEALPEAVSKVLGLEQGTSLADVMTSGRELLLEQGVELVLLIEDLALYENQVDRALLEAMLVTSTSPGEPPRCRMRTAFAITEDPFGRLRETVRSRAIVYRTGVSFGEGASVSPAELVEFVGAYLNAARLGPTRLEDAFQRADPRERLDRSWVPNACSSCKHRPSCHDPEEGFGSTQQGYGLYPYNRAALARAVGSLLPDGRFDPRAVTRHVVGDVLALDARSLEEGRFPNRVFARRFQTAASQVPLSTEVQDVLSKFPDPDRRGVLLTFWGNAPAEPVNLGRVVHEAFVLPPVEDFAAAPSPAVVDATSVVEPPPPPTTRPATSSEEELREIDMWLSEDDYGLPARLATRLRDRLAALVRERIDWNSELLRPELLTDVVFSPASFVLEKAAGRPPKPTAVSIPIRRVPEDALVLKSVLRFDDHGHWGFPDGARAVALLSARVDDWAEQVVAALRAYGFRRDGIVRSAVHVLHLVGKVAGDGGAWSEEPVVAARALFSEFPTEVPPGCSRNWERLIVHATARRAEIATLLLQWVHAAQGETGGPLAVDLQPLIDALADFEYTVPPLPKDVAEELRTLRNAVVPLLPDALASEVDRLLDAPRGLEEVVDADARDLSSSLREAVYAARDANVFEPRERFGEFDSMCATFSEFDLRLLEPLLDVGRLRAREMGVRLRAVLDLQGAAHLAADVRRFVEIAEDYVSRSLERARSELQHAPDVDAARDDVRAGIDAALAQLGAAS